MASAQGTATLNFGAYPGNSEASVAFSSASISVSSKAEAYFMGDDTTSDHTASDHRYGAALIALTIGTPTAGVGATIYGRSLYRMQGTFLVRWIWAD